MQLYNAYRVRKRSLLVQCQIWVRTVLDGIKDLNEGSGSPFSLELRNLGFPGRVYFNFLVMVTLFKSHWGGVSCVGVCPLT